MKNLRNISAVCVFGALSTSAPAGNPATDVWPKPQQVTSQAKGAFSASELDAASVRSFPALVEALRSQKLKPSGAVKIKVLQGKNARQLLKGVDARGGYALQVQAKGVTIAAADDAGIYYATQTLAQMIEVDGMLDACSVVDWPDMPFRGSIEGFYGKPWEHERRLSQIRFYGKYKMNAYIYGPKDDPYSGFNSHMWREEYPAAQAEQISELVQESRKNHVHFIWALHPGGSIRWDDKDGDGLADDVLVAMKKLEAMYALGVRSFAIFFDDISGEGAKAEKQAEMLNYINREFIKKQPDVTPLVMCPTEYFSSHGGEYKKTLGEKLDKDVDIMWTGPSICADIPVKAVEEVTQHWQRKPFIWWNWPVDDYCRNNLLLGRTYGLDVENKGKLAGFASNPMDKPEASKIGLFSIANWAWNVEGFDSQKSWEASFQRLFPEVADAMYLFAQHNSDQGKNFHGYRREESVAILPAVEEALKNYREKKALSATDYQVLTKEFTAICAAAEELSNTLPQSDPALWHEIEYWVKSFGELGKAGKAAVELAAGKGGDGQSHMQLFSVIATAKALQEHTFFEAQKQRHFEETFESDKRWATGGKVATLVLSPLVEELFAGEWAKATKLLGADAMEKKEMYAAFSNVAKMKELTAERDGNFVSLRRVLEVVTLAPKEHVGLALPEGLHANYIHVKLSDDAAAQSCEIEVSKDGEKWSNFEVRRGNGELQNPVNVDDCIRFFRLVNTSEKAVEFRIDKFKFDVPGDTRANSITAIADGDPASFYTITKTQTITGPRSVRTAYVVSDAPVGVIKQKGNALMISPKKGQEVRVFEVIWR